MISKDSSDHFIRTYGDLLYDLCESILQTPTHAQLAFRSILKQIHSESRFQKFCEYERSWVLRIACKKIINLSQKYGRRVSPEDQIKVDAKETIENRFEQFDTFFNRLMPEDQILLILKDKHGIPFPEISSAMVTPVGSLKMKRQQALRTLEEWLWNTA